MSKSPVSASGPGISVPLSTVVRRLEAQGLLVEAPDVDPVLRGVTDDSRQVVPGALFCAWAGTAVDAHGFVADVAEHGAAAAIVERKLADVALPQVVVRDGRRAAAVAAAAVLGDPGTGLALVGVTGTNGKTTTVWILRHLLSGGRPAASIGTLGVLLSEGPLIAESLTTPGPVELARTFAELKRRGVEAVAMEVSSHALDQGRVEALRFDAALFTNLTRDHLDYHGTVEVYHAAKLRLVSLLRPDGVAIVNADDDAWRDVPAQAPRAITFSATGRHDAAVRAEDVELGAFGARFRLVAHSATHAVELPLVGDYNVANAVGAAAACIALGDEPARVAAALAAVPQVPGRLERIGQRPCAILRDYAHTPDALDRALHALRPLVTGRLIVVFGAGGDRDRGKRPLMGAAAAAGADVAIVTSDNPRTEDPEAIIDDIVGGMGKSEHIRIVDRRAAIAAALERASRQDVILLAGKGHETYQIVGTEKRDFDERRIVAELVGAGTGGPS